MVKRWKVWLRSLVLGGMLVPTVVLAQGSAYGLDAADRASLVATVVARLECLIATARTWATQGRRGWVEVWRDTGGRQWQAGLAYVRSERSAWETALAGHGITLELNPLWVVSLCSATSSQVRSEMWGIMRGQKALLRPSR